MLKIRLRRMGAIRQPHYRIVVADARAPRDGDFIEILGSYNPRTEPATIQVDITKYDEWKRKGAQPTGAVERLVRQFVRAARKSGAATEGDGATETATPPAARRTRAASGKRMSPQAAASAPTAEDTTSTTADTAGAAEDEPVLPPSGVGDNEPLPEEPIVTPEGAADGEADTDTAV